MAPEFHDLVVSGDERKIAQALRDRSLSVADISTLELRRLAWETSSATVRNAAALALLARHASDTAELLLKLISRHDTRGTRGPLLHGLNELRAPVPLRTLVSIIGHGSIEAREEALVAIEYTEFNDVERRRAVKLLQRFLKTADRHTISIITQALRLLTED